MTGWGDNGGALTPINLLKGGVVGLTIGLVSMAVVTFALTQLTAMSLAHDETRSMLAYGATAGGIFGALSRQGRMIGHDVLRRVWSVIGW